MGESYEVVAALLHDVLEDDMNTTPEEFTKLFGQKAGAATIALTKRYKRDGSDKLAGLNAYYSGLKAAPEWVRAIKLCDRIHNLRTLELAGRHQEKVEAYLQETREKLLPLADSAVTNELKKAAELLKETTNR